MNKLVFTKNPILIKDFSLSKIKNWNEIEIAKTQFVNDNNIQLTRFPGFSFSSQEKVDFYFDNYYQRIKDVFTPPRGNLRDDSSYMMIGIKPGSYFAHLSLSETSWLLGPSSKMLWGLTEILKIYPYYTNVYKFHRDEETGDVSSICREIEIVKQISPNIIPVFLGNYPEYEKIIDVLKLNSYKKIWHPAYLTRNYSIEKMKEWKRRFLEQ